MKFDKKIIFHDVIILGSGGSGLASAIFAAKKGYDVAVISKVHPLQSHTVAAQGGINASLGNVSADDWRWHAYDTMKASGWLADQDSVEYMCKSAPDMIALLDELGVNFDRNMQGKIQQKIYGGQTQNFGGGNMAHRACFSKDRTGHSIMHKLYEEAKSLGVIFYNYNFVIDLITDSKKCYGAISIDNNKGIINAFRASNVVVATGGYSQIYSTATSAALCTGDGNGIAVRANIALQDMEFIQFHPTALTKIGVLITEAARSAGGRLVNSEGEYFMDQYAPKLKELATRDVIARAIATEINAGKGCGDKKDHVLLDLTHLSIEYIKENLPTIYENCMNFGDGIDPSVEMIPVSPAAHYTMGGIPTNNNCQVEMGCSSDGVMESLFAIGEAASISVHGSGRLGCNSLLDLLVFAKKSTDNFIKIHNKKYINDIELLEQKVIDKFIDIFNKPGGDLVGISNQMKDLMSRYVGVFRDEQGLNLAREDLDKLYDEYQKIGISEESLQWNIDLKEYLELGNMLESAKATVASALWRKESRGAHFRSDFPNKSDQCLVHTLYNRSGTIAQKEVRKGGFDFLSIKQKQ